MSLDLYLTDAASETVGRWNCTHNLTKMAAAVDLYRPLWRGDEIGLSTAAELRAAIEPGVLALAYRPALAELDAPNGWGTWERFVPSLFQLLAMLAEHPAATVEWDR